MDCEARAPDSAVLKTAICHDGVWLPAGEQHLIGMMSPGTKSFMRLSDGRPAYQRHKYLAALKLVREPVSFVDIGAHCGLWSMQAELDFGAILAFEPHPVHAAIYPANMRTDRWQLIDCALGDRKDWIGLSGRPGSSGDTHVSGPGTIPMSPLDSLEPIERIDLMKIDTEGYELPILRGAVETIWRTKPVIVVEQKGRDAMYHGGRAGEAVAFLKGLGMVELAPAISGDFFMGWPA